MILFLTLPFLSFVSFGGYSLDHNFLGLQSFLIFVVSGI